MTENKFEGEYEIIAREPLTEEDRRLLALTKEEPFTHGGAGSGNWGHAGRPGEVGGSVGGGGGGSGWKESATPKAGAFNKVEWEQMDMNSRRAAWGKLSLAERDRLADAPGAIARREADLTTNLDEWVDSGSIYTDVRERVSSASDDITFESQVRIAETVDDLTEVLGHAGMSEDQIGQICRMATDTLLAQEMETYNRQLGDHGITHIQGDIGRAVDILNAVPGADTADQIAEVYIAGIFHDTGYLTEPSQVFLDEGHPRWSLQSFTENIAPFLRDAGIPEKSIANIGVYIRNHDSSDIDWVEDPVGSAFRVADNTSLFDEDKMPPVFKYVPENLDVMVDLESGKIGLKEAQEKMRENVRSKDTLTTTQKIRLEKAVEEATAYTAKATLGTLGGKIEGIAWKEDHINITIKPDETYTRLQEVADVGQRQFGKFAESYGQDPEQFKTDLSFKFADKTGKVLLEGTIDKVYKHLVSIILGGSGSGNWGHAGRPGEVGGSGTGGGSGAGSKEPKTYDAGGGRRVTIPGAEEKGGTTPKTPLVRSALKEADINRVREELKQKTGVEVKFALTATGKELDAVNATVQMVNFCEENDLPMFSGTVEYLDMVKGVSGTYDFGAQLIQIDVEKTPEEQKRIDEYQGKTGVKWTVSSAGKGYVDTQFHEYAHFLYGTRIDAEGQARIDELYQKETVTPNTSRQLAAKVSEYSRSSSGEYFSEVFTLITSPGYKEGTYPRDKEFVKAINDSLKRSTRAPTKLLKEGATR
jgi:hypothetical protein